MNQFAKHVRAIRAPFRADNSVGHCFLETERIADRQNKIAGLNAVGISELERLHSGIVDLQYREIDLLVRADEARFFRASVTQLHFDFINLIDDVIVGDDVAFVGHDHARA